MKVGAIPVYIEPSLYDVKFFPLSDTLVGVVVAFQPSYPCDNDSIIYNSTLLLSLSNNDTVSVLSPCFEGKLEKGDLVTVLPYKAIEGKVWPHDRQIFRKPTKKDSYYPYWKCISCSYENTRGYVFTREGKK